MKHIKYIYKRYENFNYEKAGIMCCCSASIICAKSNYRELKIMITMAEAVITNEQNVKLN